MFPFCIPFLNNDRSLFPFSIIKTGNALCIWLNGQFVNLAATAIKIGFMFPVWRTWKKIFGKFFDNLIPQSSCFLFLFFRPERCFKFERFRRRREKRKKKFRKFQIFWTNTAIYKNWSIKNNIRLRIHFPWAKVHRKSCVACIKRKSRRK